jgi:hypothetical protein
MRKILPSYLSKGALGLMYDSSNYREGGVAALTGLGSDGHEKLSIFLDWNCYSVSSKPFLLSLETRVVSTSLYLKQLMGSNSLNLTYGKDHSYNLSVQIGLVNKLHAYASGRVVSTSYQKW